MNVVLANRAAQRESRDLAQVIFSVAGAVARADGEISSQKEQALKVVADALRLEPSQTEIDAAGDALQLVVAQADRLRGDRSQYLALAGALPWWEDFTELLTQVLVDAAGPAPRVNGRVSDPGAAGSPAVS
jgi:hypothetical protein